MRTSNFSRTLAIAIGLAAGSFALQVRAAADPPSRTIFLHYDYMVAPDHSHAPDPRSIAVVVEAFRLRGITLHIDPQHAQIPERQVVTFGPVEPGCAGPDAESLQDIKAAYFEPRGNQDWHYALFAHRVITPDATHSLSCPRDPICGGLPDSSLNGFAELPGRNFAVALGASIEFGEPVLVGTEAGTFMHELGHNLGLTHGGAADEACRVAKPNYLSIMNPIYQRNGGIEVAERPGLSTPKVCASDADCGPAGICDDTEAILGARVCVRADYSDRQLPALNEFSPAAGVGGLDETAGVSGRPTDTDIVLYFAGPSVLTGPSYGPIDWNGDGVASGLHVSADINNDRTLTLLRGFDDWAFVHSTLDTPRYRKAARDPNPAVAP